jgi:hydrogenase-4 component E
LAAAAALAWQGWTRSDPGFWALGAIAAATAGVALPLGLRRLSVRRPAAAANDTVPAAPSAVAGILLVVLAVLLVPPNAGLPMRSDVAVALAVLLLGLLTMAVRPGAVARGGGFLSMLNGALLAMAATGTAVPPISLCVALLALAALGAAGLWLADQQ